MPESVVPFDRERSSVEQTLIDAVREHDRYGAVMVLGLDANGDVAYTFSDAFSREMLVCLLLDALDDVRGLKDG